jgi:hypothetical protein
MYSNKIDQVKPIQSIISLYVLLLRKAARRSEDHGI